MPWLLLVRQVAPDEWELKRDLRLAALADAPEAFTSTYEQAAARTEAEWCVWPDPDRAACFALWADDVPAGIAIAAFADDEPDLVDVFAMWVGPEARGKGAVDALLGAAREWAETFDATAMRLEIRKGNDRALRAYARNGFVPVEEKSLFDDGNTVMRLDLTGAAGKSLKDR